MSADDPRRRVPRTDVALAGAELNRRETRTLAEQLIAGLRRR